MNAGLERSLMGTEDEHLTARVGSEDPEDAVAPVNRLIDKIAGTVPSLRCSAGIFTAYGRIYVDYGGHLELASAECDSPFVLASVIETQQSLVRQAAQELEKEGSTLFLANCNTSQLLTVRTNPWGSHESYLVDAAPKSLRRTMVPFLATRNFTGAGGVLHPSGTFIANVRTIYLDNEAGGSTTEGRALYSTSRHENLMGNDVGRPKGPRHGYRMHLIGGDGKRSQTSLVLQMGVTTLVAHMAEADEHLHHDALRVDPRKEDETWLAYHKRVNVLARPDGIPRFDPSALAVQRFYHERVGDYLDTQDVLPAWARAVHALWGETLERLELNDHDWLTRRLDCFIKYRLFTSILARDGLSWSDLPESARGFEALTIIGNEYHALTGERTLFEELEESGMIDHRVVPFTAAGDEPEAYVPATGTRAVARARFLRRHHGNRNLRMDWGHVRDGEDRFRSLADPFAKRFGPWCDHAGQRRTGERLRDLLRRSIQPPEN